MTNWPVTAQAAVLIVERGQVGDDVGAGRDAAEPERPSRGCAGRRASRGGDEEHPAERERQVDGPADEVGDQPLRDEPEVVADDEGGEG